MNWFTGNNKRSFQTSTVLIVKFLRRPTEKDSSEEEIFGKRMLVNGIVKENLGGRTRVVQECRTEHERVASLKAWFDMDLTEEETSAISGWTTEIRA
jgi:hypothetical protein